MKQITFLGFLALLFVLVACGKDEKAGSTNPTLGGGTGTSSGNRDVAITRLEDIMQSSNRETMVGKRIDIDGVRVRAVVGWAIFLVGPNPNESVTVAVSAKLRGLDDPSRPKVKAGQILHLVGDIQKVPGDGDVFWKGRINETERARIKNGRIYISADRIERSALAPLTQEPKPRTDNLLP